MGMGAYRNQIAQRPMASIKVLQLALTQSLWLRNVRLNSKVFMIRIWTVFRIAAIIALCAVRKVYSEHGQLNAQ